jgi:outer membrane protein assembly factor BamB
MVAQHDELDARQKVLKKRRRIILFSVLGVVCIAIALLFTWEFSDAFTGVTVDIQSSPESNDWTMFRCDLAHTGNAGTDALPEGNLKWTFETGAAIHSSPAIVDGIIYFGSRDGNIYALDAETGAQVWVYKTDSWVESSPAVVSGVLYCGSTDGNLYALDAKTGAERWIFGAQYGLRSSPAVADGVVYIGCDDYRIYAINAATGEEIWRAETSGVVLSAPAISKGVVVVGSEDTYLYTFNAKSGGARIELDTLGPVYASPAIKDGVAYVVDNRGIFMAIDISAKNYWLENWFRPYWATLYAYGLAPELSPHSGYLWGFTMAWNVRTISSPSIDGDFAYVGNGQNLVAVDLITHKIQWIFATDKDVVSSPAVAGNVVYVGGEDGYLYAVDKLTGEKLWAFLTGGQITSSPAVYHGKVYVASEDGILYCLE